MGTKALHGRLLASTAPRADEVGHGAVATSVARGLHLREQGLGRCAAPSWADWLSAFKA